MTRDAGTHVVHTAVVDEQITLAEYETRPCNVASEAEVA